MKDLTQTPAEKKAVTLSAAANELLFLLLNGAQGIFPQRARRNGCGKVFVLVEKDSDVEPLRSLVRETPREYRRIPVEVSSKVSW